jgi:hypothetical protein
VWSGSFDQNICKSLKKKKSQTFFSLNYIKKGMRHAGSIALSTKRHLFPERSETSGDRN